jgi:hypothetical protein
MMAHRTYDQDGKVGNEMETVWTAFEGVKQIASGAPAEVATAVHATGIRNPAAVIVIVDDATGRVVDLDLRGTVGETLEKLYRADEAPSAPRGPGRPRLGVIAREVTLLPAHWDWLAAQPGGASVTLRKLVDAARRTSVTAKRQAQERAYRLMTTLAGDEPGYEDATRALFAGDRQAFQRLVFDWPADIAAYLDRTSAPAFDGVAPPPSG